MKSVLGTFFFVLTYLLQVHILPALDVMNRREVNDFVRGGLLMHQFDHPNVMKLLGICWSDDPSSSYHRSPLIILPYMELGDLKTYLRKLRPGGSMDENPTQVWKHFLKF